MKKGENGRSMVEMLGVLSIIGILSITGIYGYATAMRKHRANEINQVISMLVVMAESANSGAGECMELSKTDLSSSISGLNVEIVADPTKPQTDIKVEIKDEDRDVATSICDLIMDATNENIECGEISVSCTEIGG